MSSTVAGDRPAAGAAVVERSARVIGRRRAVRLRLRGVLHWLHVYVSLVNLVIVLFFAVTGVTLNHPDWLATERTETLKGTLPATWHTAKGTDWLLVSEFLRTTHGVHGTVADRTEDDRQGALTFRAPGYTAATFIDLSRGTYELTVSSQGAIGVLNDLHRGRDAGTVWAWLIDAVGVFLVLLSLAGFGLLFYLKKVRVPGLLALLAGSLIVVVLGMMAA
ncbi:MAG: PepSY-associated TM helix domain-containing protein [Gemmatimonadaceae bacterium]|nr:PepSY-associated TM helix domain-containing protein [Gemmatimonadaceae bacterium]